MRTHSGPHTIGIIPARGGSTGIPNKNLALLRGKPLLAYTCEAALKCAKLDRVIVSTDNSTIAEVAQSLGVEVPFRRPVELASDDTPMVDVLMHALSWLRDRRQKVEGLVLLQPTSPLRNADHIDEAIELFYSGRAETVVSVTEVPHQFNPVSLMELEGLRLRPLFDVDTIITRRQDKPRLVARNGPAVLVVRPSVVESGNLYGDPTFAYEMPRSVSYDIDEPADLEFIGCLMGLKL